MTKLRTLMLVGSLTLIGGCQDFLDVNENPNAPQEVAANLYLQPMLHWMVSGQQWDGRYTSSYTQQMMPTTRSTWDLHGYIAGSDASGQQWRDVYWSFGQNLVDMMEIAEAEKRWDVLGVGYILKAWGWHQLTSTHGEIIIKQAFDATRFSFDYDDQEFAYQEVQRLVDSAIVYLGKTDGAVNATYLARGDKIYNGDRAKWLKFAWGLKALSLNHFTNKPTYNAQAVIDAVDKSLASNADDALLTFPNTQNDDINFYGRTRGNFTNYRQTQFVVSLLNGTALGATDPRLTRMLVPAADGQYRGLDPNNSAPFTSIPVAQQPYNPYGYPGTGGLQLPGMYLFDDKAKHPAMTYAQLQFVKAEAAFRKGDKALALQAYRNGISSHIDFVNARHADLGRADIPIITAAEKNAFLANTAVVPTDPNRLTLTMIMSQKYIAQWMWAHNELWTDMRRYHYLDVDPATGLQVFPGWTPPTTLSSQNNGKLVQRFRPRYNSEYVWNQAGLEKIGGLEIDYHTKPMWITQP